MKPFAVLPIGVALYYFKPLDLRRQLAFFRRKVAANDLGMAWARRPECERFRLGDSATLLVEPAHMDAEGLLGGGGRNPEIVAAPNAGNAHMVHAFIGEGREIDFISLLAGERDAFFRCAVRDAHYWRHGAFKGRLARFGVDDSPSGERRMGLPGA